MSPVGRLAAPARDLNASSLIPVAAALAGGLVGIVLAASIPLGVGLVAIAGFMLVVGLRLPVALSIAVAVLFVRYLSAVSVGPTLIALLLLFGWAATLRTRREQLAGFVTNYRGLWNVGLGLLLWVSLSVLWASDPTNGLSEAWPWYLSAILFLIVVTTVRTPEHAAMIAVGFVAGAVASVAIGLAGGGLTSSADAVDRATATEGRLQGGAGDPNYLAAGLVPAAVLAAALLAGTRRLGARVALLAAIALLAVGLAATQSRAGLLAAGVVGIATLVTQRGRARLFAVALIALAVGIGAIWFTANPAAWQRITSFDDGGNGRSDLWLVARRMSADHPLAGVGIGDFPLRSAEYVREPGSLKYVRLIAERPHVVHNMYLQVLVETGVVGLALFVAALMGCMAAAWRAARLFEAAGERRTAALARGAVLAQLAMLGAGFFISYQTDLRMWVLLALGPALLAIARTPAHARGSRR